MEEIKRFIERVQTDEALQAAMKELAQRKAGLDEVISLAEGHGFSFTKEEWEAAVKEATPAGELSEEQLAAVSGGTIYTPRDYLFWRPSNATPTITPQGNPTND